MTVLVRVKTPIPGDLSMLDFSLHIYEFSFSFKCADFFTVNFDNFCLVPRAHIEKKVY